MFIGYPLANLGGGLNTSCIYVFIWLVPGSQNLISGIAGGANALSDAFALLAVWLSNEYGVFIGAFFLLLAAASLIVR